MTSSTNSLNSSSSYGLLSYSKTPSSAICRSTSDDTTISTNTPVRNCFFDYAREGIPISFNPKDIYKETKDDSVSSFTIPSVTTSPQITKEELEKKRQKGDCPSNCVIVDRRDYG